MGITQSDALALKLSSIIDALKMMLETQRDIQTQIAHLEVGIAAIRRDVAVAAEQIVRLEYRLTQGQACTQHLRTSHSAQ